MNPKNKSTSKSNTNTNQTSTKDISWRNFAAIKTFNSICPRPVISFFRCKGESPGSGYAAWRAGVWIAFAWRDWCRCNFGIEIPWPVKRFVQRHKDLCSDCVVVRCQVLGTRTISRATSPTSKTCRRGKWQISSLFRSSHPPCPASPGPGEQPEATGSRTSTRLHVVATGGPRPRWSGWSENFGGHIPLATDGFWVITFLSTPFLTSKRLHPKFWKENDIAESGQRPGLQHRAKIWAGSAPSGHCNDWQSRRSLFQPARSGIWINRFGSWVCVWSFKRCIFLPRPNKNLGFQSFESSWRWKKNPQGIRVLSYWGSDPSRMQDVYQTGGFPPVIHAMQQFQDDPGVSRYGVQFLSHAAGQSTETCRSLCYSYIIGCWFESSLWNKWLFFSL